ncbi:hypothetical protein SAMN05428985_102701 [Nocardioides sp. YR527]|uniref:hypothetical protein n=1 Tax=Nocardioides sp. YR527 TaxID=1881028 RepID=UPI00087E8E41|nr:hypothetical protein [Nocardioides sp. YR527]SDK10787.1 hypothetical protein SAMN05428985_102701 [Nocardioides sp. YR527]
MVEIRRDLDSVATALGVTNDADACALMRRLEVQASELEGALLRLHNAVPQHGRPVTAMDEFAITIHEASKTVHQAWTQLMDLRLSFQAHERGQERGES